MAEFYKCQKPLNNLEFIREQMLKTAEEIKSTVVGHKFHVYSPTNGISGIILIAESHLSIHTWPEEGYAAIDIYTCGDLDPREGVSYLQKVLQPLSLKSTGFIRG